VSERMSDQRVAVVTGASSGIGGAIARQLAAAGFRVFGTSRRAPKTAESGIEHVPIDVDDDESVREGVDQILRDAGRIDVLVNNAGYLRAGAVEEISVADAQAQFATNYFGVVRMTLAVLPGMRERRHGHLITISSLAGLVPVPFWGHYNASKFAVEGLMETLRHEVRPFGVQVALVEPGAIKTALYDMVPTSGMAAYAGPRERAFGAMAGFEAKAPGPDVVARRVVSLAEDPHPSLRNTVTREAKQFTLLKWALPSGAFEAGVRSGFKLRGDGRTIETAEAAS
jgi:NAD(P)-dependent dehydrogenase (short-subunit alcohol dehydrogenase family)